VTGSSDKHTSLLGQEINSDHKMASGSGTVVQQTPHHPKVNGLSPAGTERK
jgi:hypothetical protein